MDLRMEQRLAIKFCFKAGKSATETLQMVNAAYGDQALSRSNVFRWYGRFRDGREDIEDDSRSGRPTECHSDNNVEKISQLLHQNRHLSLRMLADEVNIGKDTVRKIVVEDLRKRKICSRFVPNSSAPEQKDRRTTACRDLIATADSDPDFFKKIVTGDETWCFAYDLTTKCQSAAWVGETSPRLKKLRFQESHVKTMLMIFSDWQGIIHKEFVLEGETLNKVYYKVVMERLLNRIRRVLLLLSVGLPVANAPDVSYRTTLNVQTLTTSRLPKRSWQSGEELNQHCGSL
jgi:transposase